MDYLTDQAPDNSVGATTIDEISNQLPPNQLQQTLALVKPDAIHKAEEIIRMIHRQGFTVLQTRRVKLSAEQAASFYQDAYDNAWFQGCVKNLSTGPSLALQLSGPDAVNHWAKLVGPQEWEERKNFPKCLGFLYGTRNHDHKNGVHASQTMEDALREIHFFFPNAIVEPLISTDNSAEYLDSNIHPVLTVGLSKLAQEKPEDPVMWLADWLLANNPNKPKENNPPADRYVPGQCK